MNHLSFRPFRPAALLLFLLILLTLAACATPPGSGGYQPDPALLLSSAQTAVARATGTQQAAAAAAYESAMRGTAEAAARQQATAEVVTATAAAATATRQAINADLEVRATQLALEAIAGQQTREHQATAVALEQLAQAEALLLRDHEAELANRRRQETIALQRQQVMVYVAPVLWFLGLAGLVFLGWQLILWQRQRNRVVVERVNGRDVPFTIGPNIRVLPGRVLSDSLALPPPAEPGEPTPDSRPADWGKFIAWNRPVALPLGAVLGDGRRPALILDRNRHPHVLAAGTSGSGKSVGFALPYTLAMWAQNAHIVVVNAKGADFHAFQNLPNITFFPNLEPLRLIEPLAAFLEIIHQEGLRRDEVLRRYNAASWRQLPPTAGESGEILLFIDEFLTLVKAGSLWKLQIRQEQGYSPTERRERLARVDYLVDLMWAGLNNVASVNRKHGIHLAVTMTDPTESVLGPYGMELRRQCVRLGFPMESAAASRAFLEVGKDDGFPRGSVGLPVGQFIAAFSGQIVQAATFHPTPGDVSRFAQAKLPGIRPFPLPAALAEGVSGDGRRRDVVEGEYRLTPPSAGQPEPPAAVRRVTQAEQDGRLLETHIATITSPTNAAEVLGQMKEILSDGVRPSAEMIRDARAALAWRVAYLGCEQSRWLLQRGRRQGS
ncbi:MAG: hypothetical protein IPH82_25105 [Chloroflexi bacterium]|nr:hypothetical protein [Chloroflexota bacterium]